jgi:hypothetical protein
MRYAILSNAIIGAGATLLNPQCGRIHTSTCGVMPPARLTSQARGITINMNNEHASLLAIEAGLRARRFSIRSRMPRDLGGRTIWVYRLQRGQWSGGLHLSADLLAHADQVRLVSHEMDNVERQVAHAWLTGTDTRPGPLDGSAPIG